MQKVTRSYVAVHKTWPVSRRSTDILRILAVTCIVFNHTSWAYFATMGTSSESLYSWIVAVVNQFGKPSVLFFLFLSGVAFSGNQFQSAGAFYKNRLLRIVPAYVLASLIFAVIEGRTFFEFFGGLFTGGNHYHLYFVAVLLYLYLAYPLLSRWKFSWLNLILIVTAGIFIHALASVLYPVPLVFGYSLAENSNLSAIAPGVAGKPFFVTWMHYFSYAWPFFQMGLWMPEIRSRLEKLPTVIRISGSVVAIAAGFIAVFIDFLITVDQGLHADPAGRVWRMTVAVYALAWISMMSALPESRSGVFVKRLARSSFLVYLFHPLVIMSSYWLDPMSRIVPVIVLSWLGAVLLHKLAKSNQTAGFLLGEADASLLQPKVAEPVAVKSHTDS